jgi:predicted transcriptional regulator
MGVITTTLRSPGPLPSRYLDLYLRLYIQKRPVSHQVFYIHKYDEGSSVCMNCMANWRQLEIRLKYKSHISREAELRSRTSDSME